MFGVSQDRMTMRDRMRSGQPGDVISAAEVSRILQRPCKNSKDATWQIVAREIPYLERQHGVFWRWDGERELWHCLHDHEKPKDCERRLKTIRKKARRNVLVAQSADFSKLDDQGRAAIGTSLLVSGAVEIITRGKSIKKLTEYTTGQVHIPTEQTLLAAVASRHKIEKTNGE